ncbi:MAG: adenine deaminase C-terminal domain-containing protein [Syntrophorhabdaceae bacterium]|nr:adenine deaminase C-terminal domain-containing protein [Syntrophorhabdaceae bacterium]
MENLFGSSGEDIPTIRPTTTPDESALETMKKETFPQHISSREESADLFLKGGTIINVYSGELLAGNIAAKNGKIVYVGPSEHYIGGGTKVLELKGKTIAPGYIEPHFHPWDVYNPISIGQEACRRGTTTVFCDDLIFYIAMGPRLFEEFMDAFCDMPIKYYWSLRTAPQSPMRDEKEVFSVGNLVSVLENPRIQSIGEITRWMELIKGNSEISRVIARTKELKKRVDGHTAGARYDKLNRLALAGMESCHESINGQNVLDRLRLGFYVMLRESSLRPDLSLLLKTVTRHRVLTDRLLLTTDGSMPEYYHTHGVTDHLIRIALKEGIDPINAYRMVTINPAVYFGFDHKIGGIAPGRDADMVILGDIHEPTPEMVISNGRIVSEKGKLVEPFPQIDWETYFPRASFSKRDWKADKDLFRIPVTEGSALFPVIELTNPAITHTNWVDLPSRNGFLEFDTSRYLMVAMISRDGDWITMGLLEGFGSGVEALVSSYNTAAQILVIGTNPEAMSAAVNRVLEIKGGIVIFDKGRLCYELALPIGGVMSEKDLPELAKKEREFQSILFSRGYPHHDPMYTLVFLPNDFLPEVRVNYRGIIDVKNNKVLWPRRDLA